MSVMARPIRETVFDAPVAQVASATAADGWVRAGCCIALIAAPLAFGATTTSARIALAAAAWAIFLMWLAARLYEGRLEYSTAPVLMPAALLLALTSVHWAAGLSANPPATQLEWLRWTCTLALAVAAGETFVTLRRLRQLASVLAVAGLALAVFGIAQYLTGNGKIYWLVEPAQGGWIFGPYVNRNHFAGLMELWLPLALGLALLPENTFLRRWLWCLVALVMATAVALSGSRGGMVAIGVQVLVLTLAAAALRGRRALLGLSVAILLLVAALAMLGRGEILERYQPGVQWAQANHESTVYRMEAWAGAMEIFRQHWLLGAGLETFGNHFPGVRSFSTDKSWTYAHNDFLQFAAETGVAGMALAGWALVAGAREAWRNLQRTRGTATGALLAGVACACLGFLVHGWVDFNFHIPANAANFSVLAVVLTRRGWDED
jgi:O-antigen ligase